MRMSQFSFESIIQFTNNFYVIAYTRHEQMIANLERQAKECQERLWKNDQDWDEELGSIHVNIDKVHKYTKTKLDLIRAIKILFCYWNRMDEEQKLEFVHVLERELAFGQAP